VCAGLLESDHAKEQALQGFMSEPSTSGKKLIELGCKKEHFGSLCRGLAHSCNEPEHCVENGVCKGGRKCTVFDFFVKFQGSFDVKFDGALGRVLLHIKRFGTKNWEEFEPPVLQKEQWKAQMFDHLVGSKVLARALTNNSSGSHSGPAAQLANRQHGRSNLSACCVICVESPLKKPEPSKHVSGHPR
jgi:hypothetical protein